jgi:hypothetical protein
MKNTLPTCFSRCKESITNNNDNNNKRRQQQGKENNDLQPTSITLFMCTVRLVDFFCFAVAVAVAVGTTSCCGVVL